MLAVTNTNRFEHDIKRVKKQGKEISKMVAIVDTLRHKQPLAPRHRDHKLTGNYKECRECHIQPDWLLIYRVEKTALILERTGSHAELFSQ